MKKKAKEFKEFDKSREFAVVLERIYSEIKAVSEGQSGIADKLDATMGMVAKNKEDITMLNFKVTGLKGDLTKISGKLAKIEEDIRIIKSDFSKRLTTLETSKGLSLTS